MIQEGGARGGGHPVHPVPAPAPRAPPPPPARPGGAASEAEEIQWQRDEDALECTSCRSQFNMVNRKHHCRVCGFIFCGTCTGNRLVLKPGTKEERVCKDCYREKTNPAPVRATAPPARAPPPRAPARVRCDCALAAEGFHRPECPNAR